MSYRRVLDNLTQGEQRNADRAARFDQNMITHERNRDLQQLDAIKGFSKSLDKFVQDKYKRDDAQLQKDMELKVAEEHLEAKEQTGDPNISEEVNAEYIENRDTVLKNDKELAKTANSALEQGASFEEAKQIHNLSGAALYYYVRAKSKIAADGYEDWISGEMNNNETLELEVNGVKFTPATAETLDQKNVAMKALRREYMRQNNLGSVNPALLNDESVGFYDNVISSHNKLSKKYAKDEAISSGFEDRQKAVEEFRDDKDFEALLGKIKITANENGENFNRAEALDETFEILTDLAKTGQLSLEDLEAIKQQDIEINGKTEKVGKWTTRWLKLQEEVLEYRNEAIENAIEAKELEGKQYTQKILEEESALLKEQPPRRFTEEEIKEKINAWDPAWGSMPKKLTDLMDRSLEDYEDKDIIEDLEFRQRHNLPISQDDVDKIKDSKLWRDWSTKTTVSKTTSLSNDEVTSFTNRLNTRLKNKFKLKNDGDVKPNGYWDYHDNALNDFHRIYRENVDKYGKAKAFDMAKTEVLEKIGSSTKIEGDDGKYYDYYEQPIDPDPNKTLNKNLEIAAYAIEINGRQKALYESILPNTEDDLKKYIDSNGETVPEIYQLIADRYNKTKKRSEPVLSATDIARAQAKLIGDDGVIISDIDKELDQLDENVRELLLLHPDQGRVQRAKIEELKKDGDISYDDVQFLIEEMHAYYQTPEGKAQMDKEFPIGEEITIKPPRDLSKSNKKALKSKKIKGDQTPWLESAGGKKFVKDFTRIVTPEIFHGLNPVKDFLREVELRKQEVQQQDRPSNRR